MLIVAPCVISNEYLLGKDRTVPDIDYTLLGDYCWICSGPVDTGDEPGAVFMDNGVPVPVCSVACTTVHYAE